jgi:probable F420-dependent oxidoreductase
MSEPRLRIGLSLTGFDTPASEIVDLAVRAEAAGVDSVWSAEYFRSAFVLPAAIAQATSRIGIGTGIALAFVRTPLISALSTIDMDDLSGGRFVLGLGSQVKTAIERWHGLEYSRPAARMRETVQAIRVAARTHADEPQRFSGEFYELDWAGYRRRPAPLREPRIFVGSVKSGMIRTAVDVADGLIGHVFWSARYVRDVVAPIVADARPGFEVAATYVCAISKDVDHARRDAKRTLAFYAATRFYADLLEADGFGEDATRARAAARSNDDRAREDAVSDAMLDAYAIACAPDEAPQRLAERTAGVDQALLLPAYFGTPAARVRGQYDAVLDLCAVRPPATAERT